MSPDDPRHGTEAGWSVHARAGEPKCGPCVQAKRRGDKRRRVYGSSLVPVPDDVLDILARHGNLTLMRRTGVVECSLHIMRVRGADAVARPETIEKLRGAADVPTDIGTVRRVQALARLGWSAPEIAARAQEPASTIAKLRERPGRWLGRDDLRYTIAAAYEVMCMSRPPPTRHTSRTVKRAERAGWPPPLAWDDIDDPTEQPTAWEYQAADRGEVLLELIDLGAGLSEACRRLKVSPATLQKWCGSKGLSPAYRTLSSREQLRPNQYSDPRVAETVHDADQEVA